MGLKTEQIVKILQLKGLGRKTAFKICDIAKDEFFDNDSDLQDFILESIANRKVQRLKEYSNHEFIIAFKKGEQILEESDKAGVKILSVFDEHFPIMLQDIIDRPIILNFKGNYKELNTHDGIAIIGTRNPTPEGIQIGQYLGEQFGRKGFNVVSGLAKGCDSAAHQGCLKGRGITTALLAHGLQTIYPKENEELAQTIVIPK
jgi:DNA processing protein